MTLNAVLLALAALAQASPAPASGEFNPPTLQPGTAIWNARYWGVPVRVCGIPSTPAGRGPNTYLLSDFFNEGVYVEVTTKPPTLDDPCVTGVYLRTDGITNEAAQRLGRRLTPVADAADDIRTLYECGSREACDALIAAVERRSGSALDQSTATQPPG